MWGIRNIITYIVNIALGIVTFFLGFRILLELFAANAAAPFAAWIYSVSDALISPFAAMFPNLVVGGTGSVFDIVALIALIVYAIAARLLIAIVDAVLTPSTTTYTRSTI
jgi:YggT family protein